MLIITILGGKCSPKVLHQRRSTLLWKFGGRVIWTAALNFFQGDDPSKLLLQSNPKGNWYRLKNVSNFPPNIPKMSSISLILLRFSIQSHSSVQDRKYIFRHPSPLPNFADLGGGARVCLVQKWRLIREDVRVWKPYIHPQYYGHPKHALKETHRWVCEYE